MRSQPKPKTAGPKTSDRSPSQKRLIYVQLSALVVWLAWLPNLLWCLAHCFCKVHTSCVSTHDMRRIAVESFCDMRTIRRAYEGNPVTLASRSRIRKAAEQLGLPMPPEPTLRWRAT